MIHKYLKTDRRIVYEVLLPCLDGLKQIHHVFFLVSK